MSFLQCKNISMKKLSLDNLYSREDVHSIFSPGGSFTPGAGYWGIQGVISIPGRENDFIFFVTYGSSQAEHEFDEGITANGVLTWQSQPSKKLKDKSIQALINHNEINDNIYLFLRENKEEDYQYLGLLKYLSHDNQREKPVYFQWQLLDWNLDSLKEEEPKDKTSENLGELTLTDEKPSSKNRGTSEIVFKTGKFPDYAGQDIKNKKLGDLGEELVLKYEKKILESASHRDLAEKVTHISSVEGDGAGYDIKSFNTDGSIKYIEVKTTKGNINTDFYMSPREIKFSQTHKDNFYLYRVFNITKKNNGAFYIYSGDITEEFKMTPTGYKLSKK